MEQNYLDYYVYSRTLQKNLFCGFYVSLKIGQHILFFLEIRPRLYQNNSINNFRDLE